MGFFNAINNITNRATTSGLGNMRSTGFAGGFYDPIIGQQQQIANNPMRSGIGASFTAIVRQKNLQQQQQQQQHMRSQAPINPKAFSNQNNISGVYGQNNPGTFTRTVGPLTQMVDPSLAMGIDPTNPGAPNAIQNDMAATGFSQNQPQQPPIGVETPIAPIYDLNNQ